MIKICCVVTGNTLDIFLKNLENVQKKSDFIELRVDYIDNFSIEDIEKIKNNVYKENIFTCRSINEGGKFENNKKKLVEIINKANELKFDHIDIELSLLNEIKFNSKNSKIIGSYHNFVNTPNYNELNSIYTSIKKYNYVDIVKIATNVINDNDNIELTKLIIEKKNNIIILGMGEKGKITRIVSPLIGGYLTFASIDNNITAPGQISLEDLKKIYGI